MRFAGGALATAPLLLATLSHGASLGSPCSAGDCSECSSYDDCLAAAGCMPWEGVENHSAGKKERCVPLELSPDETSCTGGIVLGLWGGCCAMALPLFWARRRESRRMSRWLLASPEGEVRRAKASVRRHWCDSNSTEQGTTHVCCVEIGFQALDVAGADFMVSAEVTVSPTTYALVEGQGQRELEVAYATIDVRRFGLLAELELEAGDVIGQPCACFGASALGVLGLLLGALVPTTGCYLGFAPFCILFLAAALASPVVSRKRCGFAGCCRRKVNNLTVTPCAI